MSRDAMTRLIEGRPPKRGITERAADASSPLTARIERWGADGAYCAPLLGDISVVPTERVLGPCRGGLVRDTRSCAGSAHTHQRVQLPVGTVVLLVPTADGPWIANHDSTTSGGL